MTDDLGELLREGIDRATGGERLRPGLAARARQRHRRRTLAFRSAAVTGTAGTAAAAMVAATLSGSARQPGGALTVQTTSYVVSHTEQALAAAGHNLIEQATPTPIEPRPTPPPGVSLLLTRPAWQVGSPQPRTPVVATQFRSWRYHGWVRVQGFTANGRLVVNIGSRTVPSPDAPRPPSPVIVVDPNGGKWFHPLRLVKLPPPPHVCRDLSDWESAMGQVRTADQFITLIKKGLSCGMFQVGGHQKVNGTDAVRLVANPKPMSNVMGLPSPVLWVDATSFLPVRFSSDPKTGAGTDFTWLPPTPANLALLRVKVPAGAKEVRVSSAFEMWAAALAS
jgi:hypothetical protein